MGKGSAHRFALSQARTKILPIVYASSRQVPRTSTFATTYSTTYNPNLVYVPWIFEDQAHLLRKHNQSEAQHRLKKGLWWCIVSPMALSGKRTVRSWARRRTETAFKSALRESGYDANGFSLSRVSGVSQFDLRGSMRIILNKTVVTAPLGLIENEMLTLVDYLASPYTRRNAQDVYPSRSMSNGVSASSPVTRLAVAAFNLDLEYPKKAAAGG